MNDFIFPKAFAELPPNEWEGSKKECQIYGKILYFREIKKSNCVNIYDAIVRDDNYVYYNVIIQENKPYYRIFVPDKKLPVDVAKEVSCSGTYEDLGNSIIPKIGDKYYFTVRNHYDWDNYIMKYSKNKYSELLNLQNCSNNIIDKVLIKKQFQENIKTINKTTFENNNYIFFGIIAFLIILVLLLSYRLYKSKK